VVRFLTAAFALSLTGLLAWFAYFTSAPDAVFVRFGAPGALWITAGLLGSVSISAGVLAFHYRFAGYSRGEGVIFRIVIIVFTGILLCSGTWAPAAMVFG
jgi:hypothetical protein